MGAPARQSALTYADYLAIERDSDVRHQFVGGDVFAMAGGTPRHSALKSNLVRRFGNGLEGRSCREYDSDLKVRFPGSLDATYPDLSIVCGRLARHPDDRNAVTNPVVVVEVLSPTTEAFDRGDKWALYQRLESLQHYVLVSEASPRVEVFTRGDQGTWRYEQLGVDDALALPAVGLSIPVQAIYANLPEDADEGAEDGEAAP